MKLAPEDDFVLRVVQLSELLAIRHCVFLMGPTGCGRTECYRVRASSAVSCVSRRAGSPHAAAILPAKALHSTVPLLVLTHPTRPPASATTHAFKIQVLARAIAKGTADPLNDYLKMTNKKKVVVRDINPKSVSTQELYGFVNMATREWKVGGWASLFIARLGFRSARA
jgi:dynein heavy chain